MKSMQIKIFKSPGRSERLEHEHREHRASLCAWWMERCAWWGPTAAPTLSSSVFSVGSGEQDSVLQALLQSSDVRCRSTWLLSCAAPVTHDDARGKSVTRCCSCRSGLISCSGTNEEHRDLGQVTLRCCRLFDLSSSKVESITEINPPCGWEIIIFTR